MKNILFTLIVAGMLFSCKQPSSETAFVAAPVDSLIANWGKSWNNQDSAAVRNLFTDDALLTDDKLIATNIGEISAKMISPNIHVVSNFKTSKLQDWSTADRAGYTGTYELDVLVNKAIVATPKGVFTLNWIKTATGVWEITTATIYSFAEKK